MGLPMRQGSLENRQIRGPRPLSLWHRVCEYVPFGSRLNERTASSRAQHTENGKIMAAKQLVFDAEARDALRRGVEKLSQAVVPTMGARGRTAVLDKSWGSPTVTKDGVTVAEEIDLADRFENLGAQMVKEVASKTSDVAGDGTTTATLLAWSLIEAGHRLLAAGADASAVARGMRSALEAVVEELHAKSRPVEGNEEIRQVATVAANNDDFVGGLIADAMDKVGRDGVITCEEGKSLETEVKVVEGMQFDRGFLSAHFVTDQDAQEVVHDNALILIHEGKISNAAKILPLLERVKAAGRPLVIIAEDVDKEALATLAVNKIRGILDVAAVKAPGYGDRRKAMLEDIAALTGARPHFKDLGEELDNVEIDTLGTAKRIRITADTTTILEGAGDAADVSARCKQIRQLIEAATSDYDREKLQERLARLSGGIAEIAVGAATETEVKEIKGRVEDALSATRAAVQEGILPGGGVALLRAATVLDKLKTNGDESFGVQIVAEACARPIHAIAENGGEHGGLVARKVSESDNYSTGFNVLEGEVGDMFGFGIVDPTLVVRTALQNAVSVAALLLTSETLIVDAPTKGGEGMPGMEGMDDMGGMGGMGGGMPGMGGGMGF